MGIAATAQNKLAIIGSSTSACTGPSSFANCYVARLDAYYEGLGQPTDIFQLAVGGYTVYKGMPSSFVGPSPNLQPDVNNNITRALSLNPQVVLVNYPSNGYDTLRIDSIMRCLRTIRDSANAAGKTCYITTTQPRHAFPFNTQTVRNKLKELRDSILLQFGYFAINFFDGLADPVTYSILPAYDAGDGIHLNNAGHDILFQRVRDKNIFAVSLPIKLKAFNAKQQQEKVSISWTVADETAGAVYEVQRSSDGLNFQTIHTLTAASAAASRNYQVVDQAAVATTIYYRLRITENGKSFISNVIKLVAGRNKLSLSGFFVDPAKQLVVKLFSPGNGQVQINFINGSGMLVKKNIHPVQAGENRLVFSLNTFPAGTYWAECSEEGERVFTKAFRVQ